MRTGYMVLLHLLGILPAVAQFAPPAGQPGSSAMHKDSSAFIGWAAGCSIIAGLRDIANSDSGYADSGDSTMALGKASTNATVSLGDGGIAIVTFGSPIINGVGWDFAVFENSFSDDFLELAFVEVSSDGVNYYRFPATSLTQDTAQLGSFGSSDATKINNLAGKYRALYGTPFDLEELKNENGLDVNNITHVKLIDVVGSINGQYATYDHLGNKINDPWPTAFASSGFDLDAVGVIHQLHTGLGYFAMNKPTLAIYPNPVQKHEVITVHTTDISPVKLSLIDAWGKEILSCTNSGNIAKNAIRLPEQLPAGAYFIKVEGANEMEIKKIVILN